MPPSHLLEPAHVKSISDKGLADLCQLSDAWGSELAAANRQDPKSCERILIDYLKEDIINGRLDDSGPLREGRRLGLRLITEEWMPGFIEGRQLLDPIRNDYPWVLTHVALMKEAVLDFAQRRQLASPSWWVDSAARATETPNETNCNPITPHSREVPSRPRGKQPRIAEFLKARYPAGVPDPGLCPRHILKADLLKRDPTLEPLDEATLKKAIDAYNSSLNKRNLDPK